MCSWAKGDTLMHLALHMYLVDKAYIGSDLKISEKREKAYTSNVIKR